MSYKEDLLRLNKADALNLTEVQIENKIETTIAKTFMRVGITLFVAFGTAYTVASNLFPLPINEGLMMISWIIGLGLIFLMSWKWKSMSYTTLALLLIFFGFLEGYGLSGIFFVYKIGSIYQVFLTTSVMFLGLSFAGYFMRINVAKVGFILMFALIALIISMIVNYFWQNTTFDIWISIIGLIIFAGFIIYDMNILKQQALAGDKRIEILMALGLFINFINIFLFLLRLMGGRR